MGAQAQTGTGENVVLGHAVAGRGPVEVADLGGVATHRLDVGDRVGAPPPMQRQLGEAAGVQAPPSARVRQGAATGQAPVADEQRHTEVAGQP
ncbi:hypothetical protein [Kibdelosporangium aridum]|uniref:hypothetical protein n=1 Tax=Kibdelosporangium aridum TaxID=2030 RepID=UPI00163C2F91|nr:hypothetical protein [Kibdelosporangium aridum]